MKKLSKAILIAVGALIALVVAIVFGVNLYIQSPGVQARIQEEISRALRVPLKITNTSVTPWSELRITGITIPNGGSNLLEAASFNARYRLLPVLGGKLIIYNMSVDSPKLVWPQNAEGKWELPKPGAAAAKSGIAAGPAPAATATPEAAAPEAARQAAEPKTQEPKVKKRSGFQVVVEGFEIKHGNIELLDTAGQRVATFSDVNMIYTTLSPERVEGTANIGRVAWLETFVFENVHTPFNYTPDVVDLPQISGTIGGGPISGSFNLRSTEPKSPYTFGLKFDQVDLARVAKDANWGEGQASGLLGGVLDLKGSYPRFARSEGTARLTLQNGRFKEFSYFEMIGNALQIKQLSDLRLKDSSASARIADEKINFENITLDASELQLTAKGVARFDGKLQFAARLSAQSALIKQLPGLVRDNFAVGEGDSRYIDFNIGGKAAKPKTDLLDKIVGQKLETQFDELVNGLFGMKKKKDDDKKDQDKAKEEAKKTEKKKKKKDEAPAEESTKAGADKAPVPSPAPGAVTQ
ncbi:MAG: AsmA-like C-terminal region-containing protein [Chthoniobacteraceae bacterium]